MSLKNRFCFDYFLATSTNPYSARASLTERIYPSMPTPQAPPQLQQLPPPITFQPQQQEQQALSPSASNVFVPLPPTVSSSATSNIYSG